MEQVTQALEATMVEGIENGAPFRKLLWSSSKPGMAPGRGVSAGARTGRRTAGLNQGYHERGLPVPLRGWTPHLMRGMSRASCAT
jgi:hypothetical protein